MPSSPQRGASPTLGPSLLPQNYETAGPVVGAHCSWLWAHLGTQTQQGSAGEDGDGNAALRDTQALH